MRYCIDDQLYFSLIDVVSQLVYLGLVVGRQKKVKLYREITYSYCVINTFFNYIIWSIASLQCFI